MSLSLIYSAVISGHRIFTILSGVVESFTREIEQIYLDMAYSHLNSAKQCFVSMEYSSNPEQELRIGLNHLRDVFNIFIALKKRRIKKKVIFWEYYTKPTFSDDLRLKVVEIAASIALGYLHLNENKNAYVWKERAVAEFDEYKSIFIISLKSIDKSRSHGHLPLWILRKDSYSELRYEKLKKLGSDYAERQHQGSTFTAPIYRNIITNKGWDFVYETIEKQKNHLNGILEKIKKE